MLPSSMNFLFLPPLLAYLKRCCSRQIIYKKFIFAFENIREIKLCLSSFFKKSHIINCSKQQRTHIHFTIYEIKITTSHMRKERKTHFYWLGLLSDSSVHQSHSCHSWVARYRISHYLPLQDRSVAQAGSLVLT